MKDETDIKKLAKLSHIEVSEEEEESLKSDIDSILSYVQQIQDISAEITPEKGILRNVMREDNEPHEAGLYSKEILNEAPNVKDGYIEVRKIINQDK